LNNRLKAVKEKCDKVGGTIAKDNDIDRGVRFIFAIPH
jgi:hypothetical protein